MSEPVKGVLALWPHLFPVEEGRFDIGIQRREEKLKALDERIQKEVVRTFDGIYGPGSHDLGERRLLVFRMREKFRMAFGYMKVVHERAILKSLRAARKNGGDHGTG
jgi:hypothetical protein